MIYLGVDLGKNTGLTALYKGKIDRSGAYKLEGKFGQRYDKLHYMLEYFVSGIVGLSTLKIGMLVYEEPPYVRNMKTYGELCGYEAIVISYCENYKIPWLGINNRTLKLEMCGKGNASKAEMMSMAKLLSGIDDMTQDQADAVLCAFYAERLAKINATLK